MNATPSKGPDRSLHPRNAAPPLWRVLAADFSHAMPVSDYYWMLDAMTVEDSWGSLLWTNEHLAQRYAGGNLGKAEPYHSDIGTPRDPTGAVRMDDRFGNRDIPVGCYGPPEKGAGFEPDRSGGNGTGIESWMPDLWPRRWDDELIYSPAAGRMMTHAEYYRTDGPPNEPSGTFLPWVHKDAEHWRKLTASRPVKSDDWDRDYFERYPLARHPVFIEFCRNGILPPGVQTLDDLWAIPVVEPVSPPRVKPLADQYRDEYEAELARLPPDSAMSNDPFPSVEDLCGNFFKMFPGLGGVSAEGMGSDQSVTEAISPTTARLRSRRVLPSDFNVAMSAERHARLFEQMTLEDSDGPLGQLSRIWALSYVNGLVAKQDPVRNELSRRHGIMVQRRIEQTKR
ncbi:MAG: hypothetical protein KIS96_10815 [Bauldia sp.]|nr:hypothetical protein [Bauldia sp.]